MIGTKRIWTGAGLVRMLCALSLLLVAFAHKPLDFTTATAAYQDVDIAAYVLPDGTLPDLCLDDEEPGHHDAANHCEACRIVSAADLPPPPGSYTIARWSAPADLMVFQDAAFLPAPWRPGAAPRAPPFLTA